MKTKTLYLYGPPASGKTTLARRLARECGRMYLDLDEEIVKRTGRTIPEIFAAQGEKEFRRIESETLREISAPIVSLGGGTLLDPENRRYAEENGFVVVLEADPEELARRVEAATGTRPLGDKYAERRDHYESFPHRFGGDDVILLPRLLRGAKTPPCSKSHLHRVLIAEFLSGSDLSEPGASEKESDDIVATRRVIAALSEAMASGMHEALLDCGESGSTLRFFAPIAAALGIKAQFVKKGRLANRPSIEYDTLAPGVFTLPGDVSSQFVTGLLFALPILDGDSEIKLSSPLQSRGYVDMTLKTLSMFGIEIRETETGFAVPGRQKYVRPEHVRIERDWSGAAFWFAANALGSEIKIEGLDDDSSQPDKAIVRLVEEVKKGGTVDVSGCPDNYPALAALDHALGSGAKFTGTERLRLKESDRIAAMEKVFANPSDVDPSSDHRIAMAAAMLSTVSDSPVLIHNASCVNKSYPGFWDEFRMDLYAVTGWPLLKTGSPALHNEAHARAGRAAEMVSFPCETIEGALEFAKRCDVKGMAVTIPHKESVIPHLDEVDPAAAEIGAVNTVVFKDGKKTGYNTDEAGFSEALLAFAGRRDLKGVEVALLGAGGAAKAARHALERLGAEVETVHRRPLETHPSIIVNATPVDPIPDYRFSPGQLVYDMRYEPPVTPLMERAAEAGCRVENGFSMLKAQAERQLALFAAGSAKCGDERFVRTEMLLGCETLAAIRMARVAIFGLGGVGSWCAESLVRSGVRHLMLVDADVVAPSNLNRQLPATEKTIGRPKAVVLSERLREISRDVEIDARVCMYNPSTAGSFNLESFDYVIDAIDSLDCKAELIRHALSIPSATLFSSMGAALKTDVFQIRKSEFRKVEGDGLARALRGIFRRTGGMPEKSFICVWSPERRENRFNLEPEPGGLPVKKRVNGTVAHVTASFGFALAGLVVEDVSRSQV